MASVPEEASWAPVRDGVMSIDLSVEHPVEEGGSAAVEVAPVPDDTSWRPRVESDPWAEAYAESSRAQVVVVRAPVPASPAPAVSTPVNQQVQYFLDRFTRERREVVGKWFGRAGRYLDMIRDTLRDHGLPEDLAFVAMIESGFNPVAVSRAGAKGMWQFMAGTARRYGLRVDQWVDERFDPEKSTLAAAAYLRDLYAQFGSWSLAQAAYNAGEMTVLRAIRAVGSTDFWALARSSSLKDETKEFVPRIHAATVIGQDPSRYGFDVTEHPPAAVDIMPVAPGTNLKSVALATGTSVETLQALNPVLVKGVTPPGGTYFLKVPAGSGNRVQSALMPRPEKLSAAPAPPPATPKVEVHVVRPGETVAIIAKRRGVTVAQILRWNSLANGDLIRPGDRLALGEQRSTAKVSSRPAR